MRPETLAKALPWVEAAIPCLNGTHTLQDVVKAFSEGKCTLWVGRACFAITEFHTWPQKRAIHVFLAGGEKGPALLEHRELLPGIEAYGRGGGAHWITFQGRLTANAKRSGWSRFTGFGPTHAYYVKEIEP